GLHVSRDPHLLALLSEEERARAARFHFDVHRDGYVSSHVLARVTLSRYLAVAPDAIRFDHNAFGRPEIAASISGVRFNLSRTAGMTVCLVVRDRDVGVDVEDLE